MNGAGFVLLLGGFGLAVFAFLQCREADRLLAEARENLDLAENNLTCAEEFVA